MNADIKLLQMAADLALTDTDKGKNYKLAALCIRKDGARTASTNKLTKTPKHACHAECRVLKKSDYGSILYIARVLGDGTWAMSRPCSKCQALIRNRGVKRVFYTIGPGEFGVWFPQKQKLP